MRGVGVTNKIFYFTHYRKILDNKPKRIVYKDIHTHTGHPGGGGGGGGGGGADK